MKYILQYIYVYKHDDRFEKRKMAKWYSQKCNNTQRFIISYIYIIDIIDIYEIILSKFITQIVGLTTKNKIQHNIKAHKHFEYQSQTHIALKYKIQKGKKITAQTSYKIRNVKQVWTVYLSESSSDNQKTGNETRLFSHRIRY